MPRIAKPKDDLTTFGTISKKELLSRTKNFCLWCCGGSMMEVVECVAFSCQWWDIRTGDPHPETRPNYPSVKAELADNHKTHP